MDDLWVTLAQLFTALGSLLAVIGKLLLLLFANWLLLIVWLAWWLWGVSWRKVWPVLAQGAWLPVLLVLILVALVWSQIAPSEYILFGMITVPNFWWQLGAVGLLAVLALFCGYLQGVFGWTPAEIDLEPPAELAHNHGHH